MVARAPETLASLLFPVESGTLLPCVHQPSKIRVLRGSFEKSMHVVWHDAVRKNRELEAIRTSQQLIGNLLCCREVTEHGTLVKDANGQEISKLSPVREPFDSRQPVG
jgi:hypothetical protein